ncbi:MAG TPA: monofunctional biosynthetic peptidoglycan transglycosylase [Deltaproteobacteria bacterium]|nr:monofunctional biosynthetic peptidoglycan transglycosylase [Deltaproteobacteria bacterium]
MKKAIAYTVLIVVALAAADIARYFVYPDITALKKHNPTKTSFMAYREAQWARQGKHGHITQRWVRLKRISPYLVKAVIIAEDDKFWRHEGFDFVAMQKALEKDIAQKKFKAGGSTISQQLAKNLYLTPSKNPIRKLKEAILTWRLERTLSKKRIVELYLNVAEWGDGIFGIEAAARHYYHKSAASLEPHEAARLAAVLPNPIRYKVHGNSKYVRNRSAYIYRIMVRRGIVIEEFEQVMNAPEETIEDPGADVLGASADTTGVSRTDDQTASEPGPSVPDATLGPPSESGSAAEEPEGLAGQATTTGTAP